MASVDVTNNPISQEIQGSKQLPLEGNGQAKEEAVVLYLYAVDVQEKVLKLVLHTNANALFEGKKRDTATVSSEEKLLEDEAVANGDSEDLPITNAKNDQESQFYTAPAGFWQVFAVLLQNIDSIQKYLTNGVIPLSNSINDLSLEASSAWLKILNDVDLKKIREDIAQGGDQESAKVNADTATLNVHQSEYNQITTFYSGIVGGSNQHGSDVSQTLGVIYQEYTNGPQSQLQIIAQIA